ncbi:L,D-transpeptidase [Aquincola sp. S2]|uniref:L,D-transpeptidase n=1 Tax=Pseudaquabacterium terrae TaxID=2732868 RepID=A0ABX2EHY6_9BURK|nr:L,D-transpeptidase [Aquabacterium terrae]NRF68186.1 L,D-transpeptidase [Aquabacterium terrae]
MPIGLFDPLTVMPAPRPRLPVVAGLLVLLPALCGAASAPAALAPADREAARILGTASPQVRLVDARIRARADNAGRPFAIIDKSQARLFVYDAGGRLQGVAPVLLGLARGDHSVPGIGERPIERVRPHERTTPAGRFAARPGRNAGGEDVVWVDYASAVSMHRLRATDASEHRPQRLATPSPADNRISYGCINMPPAFFDHVVRPLFARGPAAGGVVYVLPETRTPNAVFRELFEAPDAAGRSSAAIDARAASRLQLARRAS